MNPLRDNYQNRKQAHSVLEPSFNQLVIGLRFINAA